jgi:hypothetical protein
MLKREGALRLATGPPLRNAFLSFLTAVEF